MRYSVSSDQQIQTEDGVKQAVVAEILVGHRLTCCEYCLAFTFNCPSGVDTPFLLLGFFHPDERMRQI